MTLQEAKDYLTKLGWEVKPDGFSICSGDYGGWDVGDDSATLDGVFTALDLEAILTCMREM